MVRHRIVQIEPTEPSVSQMERDFLAQLALRGDAVAVTDDQHSHHQLRINQGASRVAVKGRQLAMNFR
jgi:uncharacterized Zn-binding protein involved in type VI secretion